MQSATNLRASQVRLCRLHDVFQLPTTEQKLTFRCDQVIVQVDQESVNYPTQQTCFAHFYLCICQLCFITKTKLRNRKSRAGQLANQESPNHIVEQPDVRLSMDQFHFDRLEQKPGFVPRVQPAAQGGDQGLSLHNNI